MSSAPTLSEVLDLYAEHRRAKGVAPLTRRNEMSTLRNMLAHMGNLKMKSIRARHLDLYLIARGDQIQPSTYNHELSQIKVFFKWCERRRMLGPEGNPATEQGNKHFVPRARLRIKVFEFDRLLDLAPHPTDRIVFALGIYTMLRQGDIRRLRVGHVDLDNGYLHTVIGKTSQLDDKPISTELDKELRTWLTWYTSHLGRPLASTDFLVPAKSRPRYVKGGVQTEMRLDSTRPMAAPHRAIHRILQLGGYDLRDPETGRSNSEGVHTLRRSAARALFDKLSEEGYDGALKVVQSMLNHANASMTERYLGLEVDRVKRDDLFRGKSMYASPQALENVTPLRKVANP
jgi:integrase